VGLGVGEVELAPLEPRACEWREGGRWGGWDSSCRICNTTINDN